MTKKKRVSLTDNQIRTGANKELSPSVPVSRTPMVLSVFDIDQYDKNPRRSRNKNFTEIKESIRKKGLEHSITVTQRPGEDRFIVKAGGNTRLTALKELFEETKDTKFRDIDVIFEPYVSESDNLVSHLIENEMRGDLTLIDRAQGLEDTRAEFVAERGMTFSDREFSALLREEGYSVSQAVISILSYAFDRLYPYIPTYLNQGMGKAQVEKIRKFENQAKNAWGDMDLNLDGFNAVFSSALAACEKERDTEEESVRFNMSQLIEFFCSIAATDTGQGIAQVRFFVDRAINIPRKPTKEELAQYYAEQNPNPSVETASKTEVTETELSTVTTSNEDQSIERNKHSDLDQLLEDEQELPPFVRDLDEEESESDEKPTYPDEAPSSEPPTLKSLRAESLDQAINMAKDVGIEDLIIKINDGFGWILANTPQLIHFPNGFVETDTLFNEVWRVWQFLFSVSGANVKEHQQLASEHITESNNDLKRALLSDFESINSDAGLYLANLSITPDFWIAADDNQVKAAFQLIKTQRQIKRLSKAINAELWKGNHDE